MASRVANSGKVILVTGANGQLGHEMQRVARHSGDNYIFADRAELDITDRVAVIDFVARHRVDVIINCAAYTNVDGAEDDFDGANLVNNVAVGYLAEAAKSVGALLIHLSTDYVFDGRATKPYKESDSTAPIGVYGKTKLAGERAVEESGCRYIIIRTSWLYSAFGGNFVKSMLRLTAEREEIGVVADQFGTPTFAGDLADVIAVVLASGRGENAIYHYSNEGQCSWFDFASAVCDIAGNECVVKPIASQDFASRVERPSYSVLDKSKIKSMFGVDVPKWRDSLERSLGSMSK